MKTIFTFACIALLAVAAFAQEASKSTLTQPDQLQIAVQKICPVTGAALGSMGDPLKVQVGEQIAYLCCKGCQGKELNAEHTEQTQDSQN